MTDSPRRGGNEPSQPPGNSYPGYTDPAYASQAPYVPPYQEPPPTLPTEPLPQYSSYGYHPDATRRYAGQYGAEYPLGEPLQQPPPEGPKAPHWLWFVAAAAILIVVALVIALVITSSSRQQTVVAPPPSLPAPGFTTPTPTTTPRMPVPIIPLPTITPPTPPSTPGVTETVTYDVTGDGRAINITYLDTGGVLQTEFNVRLPWSKQVELPQPAQSTASVSVINVGHEVTCSVKVNGVNVEQRTGTGLTICVGTR